MELPSSRLHIGTLHPHECIHSEDFCGSTVPVYTERRSDYLMSTPALLVPSRSGGISAANRREVEQLNRSFARPFTVSEAAEALRLDPAQTRRQLGYLSRRGWLTRVRRGLYLPVPLEAPRSGEWIEDPWVVAATAFAPCYIGGWSACEHWGLTEQIFRDVVVVTSREMRQRRQVLQGMPYLVTTRSADMLFGTRRTWRRAIPIEVSDPSRTLIDVLDDPMLGGGIRHITAVVAEYLRSDDCDMELLIEYGDRVGNRSAFKRLGWILEVMGIDGALLQACRERRSAGLTKLDPSVGAPGRVVRRWNLRVNVELQDWDDAW